MRCNQAERAVCAGVSIHQALQLQSRLLMVGNYRPLGQLLLENGAIMEGQLDEALEKQTQDACACSLRTNLVTAGQGRLRLPTIRDVKIEGDVESQLHSWLAHRSSEY